MFDQHQDYLPYCILVFWELGSRFWLHGHYDGGTDANIGGQAIRPPARGRIPKAEREGRTQAEQAGAAERRAATAARGAGSRRRCRGAAPPGRAGREHSVGNNQGPARRVGGVRHALCYTVEFRPAARKAIDRLHGFSFSTPVARNRRPCDNPRPTGWVKMTGRPNLWRVRVGNYRIVYEIHDARCIVVVMIVAHRRESYRGL